MTSLLVQVTACGTRSLHAAAPLLPGDILADFSGSTRQAGPSRYTIQRHAHEHLVLFPEEIRFINHSCCPNVFFDVDRLLLTALRSIALGEEICCFYPATEWAMAEPFTCSCGDPRCLGRVTGAEEVDGAFLLAHRLSSFVRSRLASRHTAPSRFASLEG